MNFWIGILIAIVFLIATIGVFATKFLFPYHRIVALTIYAIGWIPLLYSISLKKKWLLEQEAVAVSFFSTFWVHIVFGIVAIMVLYVVLILFPVERSSLLKLGDRELSRLLKEDQTLILYLNDRISGNLELALDRNIFDVDFKNISGEEKKKLEDFWVSYVEVLLGLDLLKERYKTFYQINLITKSDLHKRAFINGYSAFLAQHHYTLQLSKVITDPNVITFLNESHPSFGIDEMTYDLLQSKLTATDELLRLYAGRAYYALLENENIEIKNLIARYLEETDTSLTAYAHLIVDKPLNFLERNSFRLWFPVQKQFAIQVSYVRTASRDYHINATQINQFRDKFMPGDIFLERREWHATNVGIPGFWTHSALFMGTLEEMNDYFQDLAELKGKSFEDFLKENYTSAYDTLKSVDEDNYKYAVIESKRPGVILMSLEASTNADSLAVLRVKGLDRSDRFKIVTQALSHFGKPYDFDFNFVTDNALVCSELIYKAYQDISQLSIEPEEFSGRLIVSANQFAEKFMLDLEKGHPQLDLILFLDGNEKTGTATVKGVDVFKNTWERPKWHIAKDFINFD